MGLQKHMTLTQTKLLKQPNTSRITQEHLQLTLSVGYFDECKFPVKMTRKCTHVRVSKLMSPV